MSRLFSKANIGKLEVRNRIVMPPMCQYSSNDSGIVKDWHRQHYQCRAAGGTGLIIVEATAVHPAGRISDRDLGLWDDYHIKPLKELVTICKAQGASVGIQLAHAGRKSTVSHTPVYSSSPVRFNNDYPVPLEMSEKDILTVIKSFAEAAGRAAEAGFDLVEIHAAHGYLLNQFLSPLVNSRTDEYGGGPEKRARVLKEVFTAVRREWPKDKPVIVRVSAEEYAPGGNNPENTAALIKLIGPERPDAVHVSSGGVTPDPVSAFPGYQIPFAEKIHSLTGFPVIAGGLITKPEEAAEIIEKGRADFIFLGRELLRNPLWPLLAAKNLGTDVPWPYQYERAK